jgi:alkylation response protein AidB-like acyl-CoA dehydrogenase
MDFGFTEEQDKFRQEVRSFLEDEIKKGYWEPACDAWIQGFDTKFTKRVAQRGWIGLTWPKEYGGRGLSYVVRLILTEEMLRYGAPAACHWFADRQIGGSIVTYGTDEQKKEYLPKLIRGEKIFTLALTEPGYQNYDASSITVKATPHDGDYIIKGTKLFVPDAHIADYLLCVSRTKPKNGITIFLTDAKSPKINCTLLKTIARDKLCEVVFDQIPVPKANILGQMNQGWSAVQNTIERAAVGKCCEMVGNLQRVLEMTVDYAKERKQFDRSIGSFQIIQHYCADMATDVDGVRFSTYQAAWLLSKGLPCTKEVAIAKAWTSQASPRVIALAHQIHGAIGVTIEHDLHYYTRRAKAAEIAFGDANFYQEVVAKEMGL